MRNKTLVRIAAIQAAYQSNLIESKDFQDSVADVVSLNNEHRRKNKFSDQNLKFFYDLSKLADDNNQHIQAIIAENIDKNWSISSLHSTLICLLQTAIAELSYFPETPTKVIISEYTNIGFEMLSDKEEDFINGILESIAKKIRPDTCSSQKT